MQQQKTYLISFIKKVVLTKTITTFYFEKPKEYTFKAGQYNRWTVLLPVKDDKGSSRFFTISSSPRDKNLIAFTTKMSTSGFKKQLLQLKSGDKIKIFGPMGTLFFKENNNRHTVYLSGGMGITPFYSMLTYADQIDTKQNLTLIASFSNTDEIIFYTDLTKIAKTHKNITIVYTITKPKERNTNINLEAGRISRTLINKYISDTTNSLFYVVGGIKTEETLKAVVTKMGITEGDIIIEQFTGY
jgi:ferredoxin-NADP reductase